MEEKENNVKAYCDKLLIGQGGYCGPQGCNPNLWVIGHCDDGGVAAFRLLLWDENGYLCGDTLSTNVMDGLYRWAGGLLPQNANGLPPLSRRNPGPPWLECNFLIPTGGAGGYTLSQYFGFSLARPPETTWRIQALASPCDLEMDPDGNKLSLRCRGEWNWDGMLEARLRVYYDNARRTWRCDPVDIGAFPVCRAPVISNLALQVLDDQLERGFARVIINLDTDVEAEVQIYFNVYQEGEVPGGELSPICDPFGGWRSGISLAGLYHTIELSGGALWYTAETQKQYCLKAVARVPEYRYVSWAKGYSEVVSFTLPSQV